MSGFTRDQFAALDAAYRLAMASHDRGDPRKVRVYTVDVPADGLGRDREYWVDQLPPPGKDVVRAVDVSYPKAVDEVCA